MMLKSELHSPWDDLPPPPQMGVTIQGGADMPEVDGS